MPLVVQGLARHNYLGAESVRNPPFHWKVIQELHAVEDDMDRQ